MKKKTWDFYYLFIFCIINNLRLFNVNQKTCIKAKNIHSQTFNKNNKTHDIDQHSQLLLSTIKIVLYKFKTCMRKRKYKTANKSRIYTILNI